MTTFVFTEEEALQITLDLWTWLAETGARDKDEWPGWKNHDNWQGEDDCALCTLCNETDRSQGCLLCPYWRAFGPCGFSTGPYNRWFRARSDTGRKRNAAIIRDRIAGQIAGRTE